MDNISVQIFGDSLNIFKWFNKEFICQNYLSKPILEEIWTLKNHFTYIFVCHIYREWNKAANLLSKEGIQQVLGSWKIKEIGLVDLVETDRAPYF